MCAKISLHEMNNYMKRMILLKQINLDTDLKKILFDYQNNCIGRSSMMSNAAKSFDILAISVLHNYFDGLIRLFSDLYLVKF